MTLKNALLIANPKSRNGGSSLEPALAVLRQAGIAVVDVNTDNADAVSDEIIKLAPGADCVIIAGGDGTVNACVRGLLESGLPMGLLPTGTANDLARTLSVPLDLAKAAAVIVEGRQRRIDVGKVNDQYFFNVASIGLSAEIAHKLTGETKRRFGRLGYALVAMNVLATAGRFHAEILSGSERARVSTLQIAIGNGRFYGGGNAVEQDAAIDDGHLDLYSLEFSSVWKMALLLGVFRIGKQGIWRDVRTAKETEFEIRTSRPLPVNLDGELKTQTPAHFSVLPGAVSVFTPPARKGIAEALAEVARLPVLK